MIQTTGMLQKQVDSLRRTLEESIISSFTEVKTAIDTHPSKNIPIQGTVHQLSIDVRGPRSFFIVHESTYESAGHRFFIVIDCSISGFAIRQVGGPAPEYSQ